MGKKKYSILYVDDITTNLFLFKESFSSLYNVYLASEGISGLEIFRSEKIDVIIADMKMPGMSGIEFLKLAYEHDPQPPRIMLTAYGNFDSVKDAVNQAKIYHFAQKPWDRVGLKHVIESALFSYQILIENQQLNSRLLEKKNQLEKELAEKQKLVDILQASEYNFRKNQNYLQNLINTAGAVLIVLSDDFKIIEWNIEAEKYFGISKNDVVFQDFVSLFTSEQIKQQYCQSFSKVLDSKEPMSFENQIPNKTGKEFSFLWNVSLLQDDDGETIGIISIGHNIDDIKVAQRKRHESERLYRLLAENTNDVIWTMNAEGKFIYVSPAVERLRGFTPEEVLKQAPEEVLAPESLKIVNDSMQEFFTGLAQGIKDKSSDRFQLQQPCKDGRLVWTEVISNKIYDEKDNFLFFLGVSRDITQRLNAEKQLRLSEEKFSGIFHSSPDTILLTSFEEDVLIDANKKVFDLTGYHPSDLIGRRTSELGLWVLNSQKEAFEKQLIKKGKVTNLEADFQTKSGIKKVGLVSGEIIEFRDGKYVLLIIRDITIRKLEEEKLRISEEKFSTIFKSSPDLIILSKLKTGEIIDANNQFAQSMGRQKKDIIGKTTAEVGFWLNKASRVPFTKKLIKEGAINNFEVEYNANQSKKSIGLISGELITLNDEKCILGIIRDITRRKASEETLRVSEERFRTIFENSVVGYYRTSVSGEILMANPTLIKMLGFKNFTDLMRRDLSKEGYETTESRDIFFKKIRKTGEVVDLESIWKKKDGTELHVSESAKVIKNSKGKIEYYDGTVIDITPRKQIEESLKKSEALFKGITEQTTQGITLFDLDGRYVLVNKSFCSMTGYSVKELTSMSIQETIVPGNDTDIFQRIKDEGKGEGEVQLLKNNNEKFYADVRANVIYIGETQLILGIITDISLKVDSQKALRRSEARLREAQKIAHIGHWTFDHTTEQVEWSDEVYKIYGFESNAFMPNTESSYNLTHPDDRDRFQKIFLKSVTSKRKYSNARRIIRSDGEIRYINEYGRTTYDGSGIPKKSLGTVQDITEIKLAEEKIKKLNESLEVKVLERTKEYKQSEKKFRDLLKFIPDGIVLVNKSGIITLVNDQTQKIFGYSKNELIDGHLSMFIPKRYENRHAKHIMNFMKKPQEREMGVGLEIFGVRKNGEEFPADIRLGIVYLDNQLHVISIIRDITQRKKDEAELRKLSQSLEQHPGSVIITDKEGKIEYVNPKFTEISGYTFNEVVGKNPNIVKDSILPVSFYKEMWDTIQSNKIWKGDLPNKRKDGEPHWMRASIAPIVNEKGQITNYVSVQYDITETKKNEELLKFTSYSFDNAADAAYWLESDSGKFVHVNKVGCARLGYTKEEFIGKHVWEIDTSFRNKSDWSGFSQNLMRIKETTIESFHEKKNGETFPVEIIASVIEYEEKYFFIAFVRDITEKKRASEELEKAKISAESANRTKSEFLANMSHEIRTPMNAVLGITDLLFQQIHDDVQRSYLKTIKTSGKSLLNIINDILDISKIEAGKLEINYSYFDLVDSIKEIENLFSLKAMDIGVDLSSSFLGTIPRSVFLDELRLRQVLTNLLSNSLKFTNSGYVKITVDTLGDIKEGDEKVNLVIKVEDSGIGIDEDFKEQVFESFSQQDGQDSKKYGGSGLGLAISYKLIKLMNGELSLESNKEVGTIFTIKLYNVKYSDEIRLSGKKSEKKFNKQDFLPSKVIIADDIEENRKYLIGAFSGTQVEVQVANNGKEAYDLARENLPNMIITDVVMPQMDGFELAEKIKTDPNLKDIIVIANSAAVLSLQPQKIEKAHFDEFLPKPIQLDRLYGVLAKYLPYSSKAEKDQKSNGPDLKSKALAITPEARDELRIKADLLWFQLQKQQKIKLVEEFSKELNRIGGKFGIAELVSFSKQLNASINAFDISAILILLKRYKDFQ